jgi:hypothetical protein
MESAESGKNHHHQADSLEKAAKTVTKAVGSQPLISDCFCPYFIYVSKLPNCDIFFNLSFHRHSWTQKRRAAQI